MKSALDRELCYVGKSVHRLDGPDKVTGHARYGVDVERPGMLYGAVLRSPLAHGRIVHLDVSEAGKTAGVRAVVTGRDLPRRFGAMVQDQPFMALERVRYVGEPVAAVAAETEIEAHRALKKIVVEYEEMPAVFEAAEAAAEGAPLIHPDQMDYDRLADFGAVSGTNICALKTYTLGDVNAGFQEADEIFEDEFEIHALAHSPMEPHSAVVRYSATEDHYTLWTAVDRPYLVVKELSDALGISVNQVRIICQYVGGGFGGKSTLMAEAVALVLARVTRGRPVKIVLSREEELTATQTRVSASIKLKTGVKKDGTLLARKAEAWWGCGAYASYAPGVALRGVLAVFGAYRTPHLELTSKLVYTNREICGPYRGYGTTQAAWACEVQMDIIAERLGIDPLELRLKNGYLEGDHFINGQVLHSVGLKETLERAGRAIGWNEKKPTGSGPVCRGRGVASIIKGTLTPTQSFCTVQMNSDGTVTVLAGSPEVGGGQKTVLAQIVAETLGVPIKSINMARPDTAFMPFDTAVASSRTTFHMGNALRRACLEVRRKLLDLAGDALKKNPEKLALKDGKIIEEGAGERATVKEIMARSFGFSGAVIGHGAYNPADSELLEAMPGLRMMSSIFWKFATQAVEVEVDRSTGVVKVLKVAAAHDVGRAINPMGCEQQIEGAVVMGISNTLFEEFKTEKGRILNDSLADYKLATMNDAPEIIPILVDAPHREGPFGAKGIGEPAAAPTAPAIANAIFDAVGVRIKDLPITPEKVLKALKEAKGIKDVHQS